jgi:hypothetical protein
MEAKASETVISRTSKQVSVMLEKIYASQIIHYMEVEAT